MARIRAHGVSDVIPGQERKAQIEIVATAGLGRAWWLYHSLAPSRDLFGVHRLALSPFGLPPRCFRPKGSGQRLPFPAGGRGCKRVCMLNVIDRSIIIIKLPFDRYTGTVALAGDLFLFYWPVSETGYHWITTVGNDLPPPPDPLGQGASERDRQLYEIERQASGPRPYLTDDVPVGRDQKLKYVRPLVDHRGSLHRDFALLEPTPDAIVKFANAYGPLGGDIEAIIPLRLPEDPQQYVGSGEQLDRWISEITRLRDALDLWDAVREQDEARLKPLIVWQDDGVKAQWDDERGRRIRLIAAEHFRPDTYKRVQKGDVISAATFAVQEMVNASLWKEKRASPRLYWHLEKERLQQNITPHGLIGAIWLDFMLAIDGDTQYGRCAQCKAMFPIPVKGKKKKFCSNKCRQADHRERKQRAEAS